MIGAAHAIPFYTFASFWGDFGAFSGYCCAEAEEDARVGP